MSAKTAICLVKSDVAEGATNTPRPLTHSLDLTKEGLAVDATQTPEKWLPVIGYEGLYEVSDQGRVRSIQRQVPSTSRSGNSYIRTCPAKIKAPKRHPFGYSQVQLWRNGQAQEALVHALVLTAFIGPCPPGLECCHNDGDAENNILSNIRWDTRSKNIIDSVRHGTHAMTRKTHCPQGHPYSRENTYLLNNHRLCRTCRRIRNREARRRKAV